jgi:hypothetical protein
MRLVAWNFGATRASIEAGGPHAKVYGTSSATFGLDRWFTVGVDADMPPASSDPTRTDTPAGLRELAARARRLAKELTDEAEAKRFVEIAEEMEAKAAALEARTHSER